MENVSRLKLISVAAGAFCMMCCNGIINNSTTYFITSVTKYLNCSKTEFSIYFTIITICSAIMSLGVMSFIRKIGLRTGMLIACVMVSCAFFLMSRLQSLWMVYAAAALIGIFQSFIVVPTISVINAWYKDRSSSVTGVVMSASGFGGLAMGLIMPSVVANLSWRTGYLVCAVIFMLVSGIACLLAGGKPPANTAADNKAQSGAVSKNSEEYRRLLHSPGFWLLIATALVLGGCNMISQHFSVLLDMRGYDVTVVSIVMGSLSIALALFKIIEGLLCEHIPAKIFVPAAFMMGTVSFLCLLNRGTAMLIVGIIGYGAAAAGCTVLYPIVMRYLYGPELATATWGICWAAFMASQAMWTPFYASVYDRTGSYDAGLITAAVLGTLSAAALGFLLVRKDKSNKSLNTVGQ